jgi:WD40 repeat protein
VAGCDEGVLYVFERDEKEIYKQTKSFQIEQNYVKILNLSLSPSEDNIVCTLANNQAFVLGLSNTDILKTEEMNFEPLALPFHHLQITGLAICLRKPLIVTCGLDRSVRVWNYITSTIEVMRFFNEPPYSIAFHPSGLHILVGFSDNLRLCNLLMDEIRPFKDFPIKACREVQFSNGGQYFAAANGSVIQLFSTWTCDMLGSFNIHKGKIKSIWWSLDDTYLISTGMDGCVYQWTLRDGSHQRMAKQDCNFSCIVGAADGKSYLAGSDGRFKVVQGNEIKQEVDAGIVLTQLALLHTKPPDKDRMIFSGTETGVVRTFPMPLDKDSSSTNFFFHDVQAHSGAVTRMVVSPDDSHLFTVGEDGCLCVFQIDQTGSALRKGRSEQLLTFAEEILVTKSDLEDKMAVMTELQNKVEELQNHNEMQLNLRELTYREKLREVTEKFNNELEIDRQRYKKLDEEKEHMERGYALKVEQANVLQTKKLEELDAHQTDKVGQENNRYETLERKMRLDHERWDEETHGREEAYSKEAAELDAYYTDALDKQVALRDKIDFEKREVITEADETKNIMEDEADKEIDELKANYDKKLTVERMTTLKLKDHNAILKRKFGALRDDINDNLDELQKMKEKQQFLTNQIESLEKDIMGHMKEIKERESTIGDKVHRIFELRKKNQELEKFKFVLDYKITELKRQIQPRKLEMKQMSEQIDQMQNELKGYKKESVHLQLEVRELELKLAGMEKDLTETVDSREGVEAMARRFKAELHQVYGSLDDGKLLKEGIKRLYQRHVAGTSNPKQKSGVGDVHKDYQRQRHYLEKNVDSLNDKLAKDMVVHKKDNQRIMYENIVLIKEINDLRREMRSSKDQQRSVKSAGSARKRNDGEEEPEDVDNRRQQIEREMETQQEQIRALKAQYHSIATDLKEASMGGDGGDTHAQPVGRLEPLGETLQGGFQEAV